ncbi:biliverdin-producing heme oxygenase [Actinotalea ferrariae]|uniref:biliverdin-producing heme oxygenase n=1 Tax=Actinotalea ferrariae TaxID=1386098 RepID=UPI001C8BB2CF|nr:biliverdin-producing heme oxygenase [Actinotalea ferrariae]MBX9243475.1 biliverdin-producing heme oxygenase [Actinotalea ferrariae]
MSSASTLEAELPLSLHLRAATRVAHERAETSGFVESLMRGELTVAAYADLAAQHHVIYTALEAAEPFVRSDPAGATMVVEGLRRVPSIERDLETLVGPGWRDEVRVLPATERYAARLREVAGTWVGGYVAHAYTRYLGDLSGGLAVKAILQRAYAVPDEAVNFYTFTSIPKPKLFKDDYRARMDALPFDREERLAVAAEAEVAFGLNTALFAELGAIHLR